MVVVLALAFFGAFFRIEGIVFVLQVAMLTVFVFVTQREYKRLPSKVNRED